MPTPKFQSAIGLPFPATLPADSGASPAVDEHVLSLFDECAPGLRRYVGSFGLGAAATDDIVQEVFLALFRHLSLGRPATNLKGWLFQVAHNLALKQRQKTAKRQVTEGTWDAALADRVMDRAANPEERLADEERRQRLTEVLRQMPERDRRCVYLRAEGLYYRDIARTLGVSLGSVAKSLVRAVTRLAEADKELVDARS
jgi:RNA polymerase sigma-70 factor (ECF subfamily)